MEIKKKITQKDYETSFFKLKIKDGNLKKNNNNPRRLWNFLLQSKNQVWQL